MKFSQKIVKNVSDRFENIIFEKYSRELTWEKISIAFVKPEPTFFMGVTTFIFLLLSILDSSVNSAEFYR